LEESTFWGEGVDTSIIIQFGFAETCSLDFFVLKKWAAEG
jgi:hypothetical protein